MAEEFYKPLRERHGADGVSRLCLAGGPPHLQTAPRSGHGMACLLFAVGCWLLAVGAAALYLLGTMAGDLGRDVHEVAGILLRSTHVGDVGWRFGWRLAYRPKSRGRTTSHLINRLLMVTARSNVSRGGAHKSAWRNRWTQWVSISSLFLCLIVVVHFCPCPLSAPADRVTLSLRTLVIALSPLSVLYGLYILSALLPLPAILFSASAIIIHETCLRIFSNKESGRLLKAQPCAWRCPKRVTDRTR